MPFTFAHPAIVLPLLRVRKLSATGLIVGSMTPDFEYFIKMRVNSHFSHTVGGVFYFDLPIAFVLAWLFLRFVRKNLIANLPVFFQCRMQPLLQLNTRTVLFERGILFAVSAVLGALSHILWDGFTHSNTFFVRNLSFYQGSYIPYEGVKYPLWYALQHISTFVGLSILLLYVLLLPKTNGVSRRPSWLYWAALIAITAVIVDIRFVIRPQDLKEGNFIVSTIAGFCIALILTGVMPFKNAVRQAHG